MDKQYGGTLVKTGPYLYKYTTYQRAAITAFPAMGEWVPVCQNICDSSHVHTRTWSQSNTKTYTETEKTAIEASLNAGLTLKGVSLGGSMTSRKERERAGVQ